MSRIPVDGRLLLYRFIKWLVIVLTAAFICKFFLFDSIVISSSQMSPTILAGDRVLLLKTGTLPVLRNILPPLRKCPAIIKQPLLSASPMCLRVAGKSGDSIVVGSGMLHIINKPNCIFYGIQKNEELLPQSYSSRDTIPLFVLPNIGDTITMDSLNNRDFFFMASLVLQENPEISFTIVPQLFIDGNPVHGYMFKDFSLYKGILDSVPEKYQFDWFFWAQAKQYLENVYQKQQVDLLFSLKDPQTKIYRYVTKELSIFLIADDWCNGYDSRFFGPVPVSSLQGRIICTLWSFKTDEHNKKSLRLGRSFKIIL